MNIAKFAAAAAALAFMPAAVLAQDAAPAAAQPAAPAAAAAAPTTTVNITQGASVTGNDGNPIGTVTQVTPQAVVVDTGTNKIPLPRNAFAQGDSGLTLNITKTALDQSYSQQMAALTAQVNEKLVAGSPVMTSDAQSLGTIDMVEGDNVVLTLAEGKKLTLGKSVFAVDGNGGLMVRATKEQIEQAMANTPAPAEQG